MQLSERRQDFAVSNFTVSVTELSRLVRRRTWNHRAVGPCALVAQGLRAPTHRLHSQLENCDVRCGLCKMEWLLLC